MSWCHMLSISLWRWCLAKGRAATILLERLGWSGLHSQCPGALSPIPRSVCREMRPLSSSLPFMCTTCALDAAQLWEHCRLTHIETLQHPKDTLRVLLESSPNNPVSVTSTSVLMQGTCGGIRALQEGLPQPVQVCQVPSRYHLCGFAASLPNSLCCQCLNHLMCGLLTGGFLGEGVGGRGHVHGWVFFSFHGLSHLVCGLLASCLTGGDVSGCECV